MRRIVAGRPRHCKRKDDLPGPETVVTVEEITNIALEERRPGCEKGVLHEDAARANGGVPRRSPAEGIRRTCMRRVYDLFISMKGNLEIRYEDRARQ